MWTYSEALRVDDSTAHIEAFYLFVVGAESCAFCRRPVEVLIKDVRLDLAGDYQQSFNNSPGWINNPFDHHHYVPRRPKPDPHISYRNAAHPATFERQVKVCRLCGWWLAVEETLEKDESWVTVRSYGGVGAIKNLDLRDVSIPINKVRNYLVGRYEERFVLNPTLFEQTVASVFGDLGYRTRATGRSGDGGIDVILWSPDGAEIGVQVKRYRDTIQVDQIRELTGALVQKGITKGIFVTTSRFAKGTSASAELSALRGYAIELVDANGFLDRLEIAQRTTRTFADDEQAPWRRNALTQIHERSGQENGLPLF